MTLGRRGERLAVAVAVGVAVVVVSRLVSPSSEYVAGPIAGALVHTLPARLLTWTIATLGEYAGALFSLSAAALAVALFGAVTLLGLWLAHRLEAVVSVPPPAAIAAAVATVSFVLTSSVVHAVGLGLVGAVIGWLGGRIDRETVSPDSWSRREILTAIGGGTLFAIGTLAASAGSDTTEPELSVSSRTRREIDELSDIAAQNDLDIPGLPGLLTPIGAFYVVDINIDPPAVDAEKWAVTIDGAVDTELRLTRDRLDLFDPVTELLTLRCIGEELNGTLMSTAVWTGVPIASLLDRAGPDGGYARLTGADRYSEVVPIEMLSDAILVYAMNGRTLPRQHGFPARVIVPGSWGKVNVKWLTGIEILTEREDGFWSQWEGTSSVNTVAKLWNARPTDGGMEVSGHAYAGDRGIEAVEVSTDGGETWNEATLSDPLPNPATWRQWRYEWRPDGDSAEVVVRAIDGEGELQTEAFSEPQPDGASGWVSRRVDTTTVTDFTHGSLG